MSKPTNCAQCRLFESNGLVTVRANGTRVMVGRCRKHDMIVSHIDYCGFGELRPEYWREKYNKIREHRNTQG